MSELITSVLVVFSEIGFLLIIIAAIIAYIIVKRTRKDKVAAKTLVETLKQGEPERCKRLADTLKKVQHLDDDAAQKAAEMLLQCEKALYAQVINMFLGKDREAIANIHRSVERMAESYQKLIEIQDVDNERYHSESNPLIEAEFRSEVKKLEKERDKLQNDLDEAMTSMDSMLHEYTQMYEGGGTKREGVKHLENELLQLRQKIAEGNQEIETDDSGDDGDTIPDLSVDTDTTGDESDAAAQKSPGKGA